MTRADEILLSDPPAQAAGEPRVILLLTADTGGGHRAAAEAIRQAVDRRYPGRFAPVACDPLTGVDVNRLVGWLCRRYGSLVRLAPWLWSLLFHGTNTPATLRILRRLLIRFTAPPIADAIARHRPLAVVALHPLLVTPAVAACRLVVARQHGVAQPGSPDPAAVSALFFPPAVSLTTLALAVVLAVVKPWGRIGRYSRRSRS